MLGTNMGNYPWLADSWPTTNLMHSGKEASVNCCTTKHDSAERYYNAVKLGKQKSMGKPVKTPSLNWAENLPPPPATGELDPFSEEEEEGEDEEDGDDWSPPLPERTYLMENDSEDVPPPPPRGEASSPAASYGQQSTATLTPSPREESRPSEDIPRLHHFDMPQLPRCVGVHTSHGEHY
ncbi:hypothetical protein AOXY_G26114 [Acipenser oxyrinchus oxyrinchus]|uniref:Uncharacterized protein n=1 Tax=Acipenser oxyrinchus oxyrinchus TaxID=40147 RepID=A0AAD8FWP2_ACIOX|nr:hypothetical protein AOXY_G26114 [Acipenser oxyrinchus oxyrinchus]